MTINFLQQTLIDNIQISTNIWDVVDANLNAYLIYVRHNGRVDLGRVAAYGRVS